MTAGQITSWQRETVQERTNKFISAPVSSDGGSQRGTQSPCWEPLTNKKAVADCWGTTNNLQSQNINSVTAEDKKITSFTEYYISGFSKHNAGSTPQSLPVIKWLLTSSSMTVCLPVAALQEKLPTVLYGNYNVTNLFEIITSLLLRK